MPDLSGNPAIDTAVGVAFVYFLLSLVVSSLTEAVSSLLQLRWRTLRRGIRELLLEGGEKSKNVLEMLDKLNEAFAALDRGDAKKAHEALTKAKDAAPDPKDQARLEALAALARGEVETALTIAKGQALVAEDTMPEDLRKRLEQSLPDAAKFENNDRIKALWKQTGFLASLPLIGDRGPSYIEPRIFALALLETLGVTDEKRQDEAGEAKSPEEKAAVLAATGTSAPWARPTPDALVANAARAVVEGVANPVLDKWLRDAITEAKGERDKLLAALESSFDAMTNRISGWYKRYATIWIVLIAAALAGALNADSYAMGSRLWKDEAVRSALVAQADKLVDPTNCDQKTTSQPPSGAEATRAATTTETTTTAPTTTDSTATAPSATESPATESTSTNATTTQTTPASTGTDEGESSPVQEAKTAIQRATECVTAVEALGLPLGWAQENRPDTGWGWIAKIGGLVITVFALMLGAPFWFDTLSKLARLRATGKPEGTGTKSE